MLKSEEKRHPFMGNRTIRDGSVTMQKLGDDVTEELEALANKSQIVMVTQAEFDALTTKDPEVFYFITEN